LLPRKCVFTCTIDALRALSTPAWGSEFRRAAEEASVRQADRAWGSSLPASSEGSRAAAT